MTTHPYPNPPSLWIARFLPQAQPGATLLDVAAGSGRHARLALHLGYAVTAIDRDVSGVADLVSTPKVTLIQANLENGSPWPLAPHSTFDVVITTNYLHRPILPAIVAAVAPGGILLYETFATGNERYSKPSNPNFLLTPGELLDVVSGSLTPIAFEQVTLDSPQGSPAAVVQRIVAAGPNHPWLARPPSTTGHTR